MKTEKQDQPTTAEKALTNTTPAEDYIPSEDEVTTASSGKSWRFAKGQIVTGRTEDGSFQSRPKIIGRIIRIGIHEGVTNDGYKKPYKQVEADIKTRDGIIYVKAGLLDGETFELRPSVSALGFAWGLTQQIKPITGKEIVQITTSQGDPWIDDKGRPRDASTYVNFAIVNDKNIAEPLYKPKRDKNAPSRTTIEQWSDLEPLVRSHPLFADRPDDGRDKHEEGGDGPTHLSLLCEECAAKGWPTPEQAPAEWLGMIAKSLKEAAKTKLSDYCDDVYGDVRQALQGASKMPGALEPAAERLKKTAGVDASAFGSAEEPNPFA